ncbi:unnamed protein product [Amoebophrya sp. A25]|nr:unnamed protein product [Amoebophrya sp. A25]|eukprot:GSA25T00015502001.1
MCVRLLSLFCHHVHLQVSSPSPRKYSNELTTTTTAITSNVELSALLYMKQSPETQNYKEIVQLSHSISTLQLKNCFHDLMSLSKNQKCLCWLLHLSTPRTKESQIHGPIFEIKMCSQSKVKPP